MNTYPSVLSSTVAERGQVTIPKQLRDRLGLSPGTQLEFTAEEGRLVAVKRQSVDPVDAVFGVISIPGGTDVLIEELRGPVR
ncbi:AbrB/MazE/SpoVT family DNA-binding domain-containing protein [soil metagenome]